MLNPERRNGRLRLVTPVLLFVLVVAACGSSSATLSTVGNAIGGNEGAVPAPSAAAASEAPASASGGQVPRDANGNPPGAPRDDLKIVYTGSLELVVDDLVAALARGRTAVIASGGYIGASQESNDGDRSVATITYRIPASRWEATLESLRGLASKVVGEQTQATEVGGQIVDLEARIRNLRASEEVLVGIAKGTGKVTDLLEVQARLSDVRGEIEQLDGQRAQLADQVAYGTMVTTFGTQVVQVQETAKGWNPGSDVDGATATLIGAAQTLASAAIWFGIVWLPAILVLLVLVLVGRLLFRRLAPPARPQGPVAGWGSEGGAGS